MGKLPGAAEMDIPVGSLEFPYELVQAVTERGRNERTTHVTDLPSVILEAILSRVPNPVDIASAFKASRLFWALAPSTPFRLRLRAAWYQNGGGILDGRDDIGIPSRTRHDAQMLADWIRCALRAIRCVMPSTQGLDLAGCPILDDDIAAVLFDLTCLQNLVLDGCQKLTSSVAHALVVSVRSGPRVLSLQRCFRLGPAAAGNLLVAAAACGSRLQAILLSHLDRLELPPEPPCLDSGRDGKAGAAGVEVFNHVRKSSPGSGLRILALHNCGNLGYSELMAIAKTCPILEVLMLGGSVDGLGVSRSDNLPEERVMAAASALVGVTEHLPRLRILEISFFSATVLQSVREQVSNAIQVWDFCDKNSVATAAYVAASLKGRQEFLCGEQYMLGLQESLMQSFKSISLREGLPESVWKEKWECVPEDVLMALKTGTNCSNMARRTPLHEAASRGDVSVVANLLSIGATASGMKDSKGATALFVAAENGHAPVCDLLLRAGADVLASNRAGETPLYIAALRGHSAAVEVMLIHCQDRGVNWQNADVYGDGWTPLMAATLAERQDVFKVILCALGAWPRLLEGQTIAEINMCLEHGGEVGAEGFCLQCVEISTVSSTLAAETKDDKVPSLPRAAAELLDVRNRYGQTALHIGALKGSLWFVINLLCAGASANVADDFGLRAVDVARKQNHTVLENFLKQWNAESGNEVKQASSSKRRSRNKKKVSSPSKFLMEGNVGNANSSRLDAPDTGV